MSNDIRGSFQGFHCFKNAILGTSHFDIMTCNGLNCVPVCSNPGSAVTEGYHFTTAFIWSEVMHLCAASFAFQEDKEAEYSFNTNTVQIYSVQKQRTILLRKLQQRTTSCVDLELQLATYYRKH